MAAKSESEAPPPRHDERARKELGGHLRAARALAGLTLDDVAGRLKELGYSYTKQAVNHWETGFRVPDALILRRLAKLYKTTADLLLWDTGISMEAIRFAAQFDALSDSNRRKFEQMWMAYFAEAKTDAEVEQAFDEAAKKGSSDFTYTKDGKTYHVEVKQTDGEPAPKRRKEKTR